MREHVDREFAEPLDAYLDGLLDDDTRAAFERELDRRPELRREVEMQRRVDAALQRTLAVPSAEALAGLVAAARRPTARARGGGGGGGPGRLAPRWWRPARSLALAAALLLGVGGAWMIWTVLGSGGVTDPYAPQPWRSVETVFRDELADGFVPDWVCASDAEFEETFRRRFGQALRLGELADGVTALGLGYCHTLSPSTVHLLAEADGEPVIVFIDEVGADLVPGLSDAAALHLHRREVGRLVLHELSGLDRPRILASLLDPDADAGRGDRDHTEEND